MPTFIPFEPAPIIKNATSDHISSLLQPIPVISKTVNNDDNGKCAEMTSVEMPKKWANFFKVFLSSPSNFAWAKKFLQTQFSKTLYQPWDATKLTLPSEPIKQLMEQCGKLSTLDSSVVPVETLILEDEEEYNLSPQSKKRARKPKTQSPVVDSEVRKPPNEYK